LIVDSKKKQSYQFLSVAKNQTKTIQN